MTTIRTARCLISHDKDENWVSMTSCGPNKNGKISNETITLTGDGLDWGWDTYSSIEKQLIDRLFALPDRTEQNVSLGDMRTFYQAFKRADNARKLPAGISIEEANGAGIVGIENLNGDGIHVPEIALPEPLKVHPLPTQRLTRIHETSRDIGDNVVNKALCGTGYGSTEQKIHQAEQLDKAVSKLREGQRFYLLDYDIPAPTKREPKKKVTDVTNPSSMFWPIAFRFGGSIWCFTDETIKYGTVDLFMAEMRKSSAKYGRHKFHITPIDRDAVATVIERAQEALCERMIEIDESLQEKLSNAATASEKAEKEFAERTAQKGTVSWKERQIVQAKRDNAVRAIIKKAANDLRDACKCAERYDVSGTVKDLVGGLRKAIIAQATAFNAHAQAVRISPVMIGKL